MIRTLLVPFLLSVCLWAQTESSLTVTSTRSISVQPDQEVLSVTVTTSLNTAFDDVLTAVASAGITAANLSSVYSEPATPNVMTLQWAFSLPVPLATLKTSLNALSALQQSIRQQNSGWSLDYSSGQLQTSADAQAAQPCPIADLLADAQAQAQKLVSASPELSLGPILALSDGSGTPQAARAVYYFIPSISLNLVGLPAFSGVPVSNPTCTLTVKFALLRYQ
jgi:Protein of unknown function (DUF541)